MLPEVCAVLVQDTWCRFASLMADNNFTYDCVGTVLPRMDAGHSRQNINKTTSSASSQSFTEQQWRTNQQDIINTVSTGIN
uniref:Uncharacterized protein n=1 Tax=Salix viminalis TaxID=40686 RepID=A0A6N2L722_SALVM